MLLCYEKRGVVVDGGVGKEEGRKESERGWEEGGLK